MHPGRLCFPPTPLAPNPMMGAQQGPDTTSSSSGGPARQICVLLPPQAATSNPSHTHCVMWEFVSHKVLGAVGSGGAVVPGLQATAAMTASRAWPGYVRIRGGSLEGHLLRPWCSGQQAYWHRGILRELPAPPLYYKLFLLLLFFRRAILGCALS